MVGLAFALDREAAFAVAADVSLPLPWRRFRLAAQLATGTASSHATVTARPAAGLRLGWLELRAGPVGSWVRLTDGRDAFIAGGHASALLYVPIAGGLRAVVEAGGDVYANQVDVTSTFMPDPFTFTTEVIGRSPRALLRGGAGVAWQW